MLKACVFDFVGSWNVHLPLNNSYHSSVRCAPFEALYGRKCRSPIMWAEIGEGQLIKPELSSCREYVLPSSVRLESCPDALGNEVEISDLEEPVEILEREFKKLKRSRIAIVKVRWNSKRGPEFT
ncbi:putative reverse transcriptase domain-containing protein [Tanacetum coccineum]